MPGVRVGHATVWRDEPDPPAGRGVARTGVTAIVPGSALDVLRAPVPAGVAVLNGAASCTSAVQVTEWGVLETPILLTSTMQVGRAWDALVGLLCEREPTLGADRVVIPMVGECDDSTLNDARRVQIGPDDVRAAVDGATDGPVAEGALGAGTGMVCFGWKGGIGTTSRRVEPVGATVGVLLLTNFGSSERLTVDGVPVGRSLRPPHPSPDDEAGQLHRHRRHRRALQRRAAGAPGPAGRPGAGPHRLGGPSRERRDLRRVQHRARGRPGAGG